MFRILSLGLPLRLCQAGPETGTSVSSGNYDGNPGYKPIFFPQESSQGISSPGWPLHHFWFMWCRGPKPSLHATNRVPAFWGTRSHLFCSLSLPGTPRDLPVLRPLELLAWVIALVFSMGAVISLWVLRMLASLLLSP